MTRKSGRFWIRNYMKSDVVRSHISPKSGFRLFGIADPMVRDQHIHLVLGSSQMPDNVGSMLLHASQHKRVNSVSSEYNVQSGCKLPQLGR